MAKRNTAKTRNRPTRRKASNGRGVGTIWQQVRDTLAAWLFVLSFLVAMWWFRY